jgi:hypothetical protein
MYEFPAVEITSPSVLKRPSAATTKAPSSAGDGFPVLPLLGGLAALVLAAAGTAFVIRRRQLRPSH